MPGRLIQQAGGLPIAGGRRLLDEAGELGHPVTRHLLVVEPGDQAVGHVHLEALADPLVEAGGRAAPVGGADAQPHRGVTEPEGRALVAEQIAPAARARGAALGIDAVGDGAGAGDDHDSHAVGGARHQGDVGVVDHPDPAADPQPPQDAADDLLLAGPVDAGDAQAERGDRRRRLEGLDHLEERLLHRQLAVDQQIGAAGDGLGEDRAAVVGQEADRLGPPGVDADDVTHATRLSLPRVVGQPMEVSTRESSGSRPPGTTRR